MARIKESVFEPVRSEIVLVEDEIRAIADVEYSWLAELLDYIVNSGGKRVRPALTLLSGKMCDGCRNEVLIPVAVGVELLHTAT
ncbi:MAG: polyprenyl synthetase family protein, partial [Dehalococcoidia bacterium]|nr:polyprenyl synthetase family protein [Dehalococcoidia bacterium]